MSPRAFISSRLDHCNAVFYSLPDRLMRRLQSVQNAAARLITGASRRDHITPILATSTTTCRLQDLCPGFSVPDQSVTVLPGGGLSARRRCQRSSTSICKCRAARLNIFGDRCFTAAGPRLWNLLPINLRQC